LWELFLGVIVVVSQVFHVRNESREMTAKIRMKAKTQGFEQVLKKYT